MTLFDVILLVILFGFVLFGFWFGLIHTLGALLGIVVGAFIAGHTYDLAASKTVVFFAGNLNLARIICFIVIFILVNRLIGFVFFIIEKIFNFISVIPFLKSINRLAGAAIGFFEGLLVIGLILYVASKYPVGPFFDKMLIGSKITPYFVNISTILTPLLPRILREIKSIIPGVLSNYL